MGALGGLLGAFGGPLGRFLGFQNRTFLKHWSKIGSKRPSGSILAPFWEGLGRVWGVWGGIWEDLEAFGNDLEGLKRIWRELRQSL